MKIRAFAAAAALLLPASLFAASISGTVTDKTTNKPAANDTVTLILLAQGMQESTQTKTDASGHYSIPISDSGVHLIRVTHQGANYFQPAMPNTATVDVTVFDVADKVDGVSGEADVMRIQSAPGGDSLDIVESFFVKNVSSPQRTQYGPRPFEFYLPPGALVESSVAVSTQAEDSPMPSMPVRTAPTPLDGKDHYAFVFPIRPGETRFQVSYHVPYHGSLKITPRPTLPGEAVVAMLPASMSFKGPDAYAQVPPDAAGAGAQTYAIPHAAAGQSLEFTVSGSGQLPRDTGTTPQDAQSGAQVSQQAPSPNDMRPGGGLGNPVDPNDTHDPWSKYKWWILSALALLLAGAAGFLIQKPKEPVVAAAAPAPVPAASPTPQTQRSQTLAALKEELFSLETERAEGRLDEASYQQQKSALEIVLKRALARN